MNEDIICLLQDLGKELSVDVIANFIIRNPDVENLLAAKMGALLSNPPPADEASATSSSPNVAQESPSRSILSTGLGDSSYKMIFVVNMDLNMGRGKQCAQVAHAALGLYLKIQQSNNDADQLKVYQWLAMGQKKIVVKGNDLQHVETIRANAKEAKLPTFLVSDAGCTQIAPGSKTVLAVFGANEELDKITGSLRLL